MAQTSSAGSSSSIGLGILLGDSFALFLVGIGAGLILLAFSPRSGKSSAATVATAA